MLARDALLLLLHTARLRLGASRLTLFETLRLGELCVAHLLKVLLVRAHVLQLLLLHHLHHRLLERLAYEYFENGLHLHIKVKQVALVDLRLHVHASLHRDEHGRGQLVHERIRLRDHVHLHRSVREFLQILLRLHVDVLAAIDRRGRVWLLQSLWPLLAALHLRLTLHLELLCLGGLRDAREARRVRSVPRHTQAGGETMPREDHHHHHHQRSCLFVRLT